jgi:ABC-type nitrate/sulfonate/bicarbonate transport system permease component
MNGPTLLEQNETSQRPESVVPQTRLTRVGWALVRALLVALGLFFGAAVAIFIGFSMGWIEIGC